MTKKLSLQPRLTEKSYGLSSSKNAVYVFDVDVNVNKHSVKRAVEEQFEVSVDSVNILNKRGKAKRTITAKGRKVYPGREAQMKKAYVTLSAGQNLPFFQAIEEEEQKQEKTQAKMEKAMDIQAAKEEAKENKTSPDRQLQGQSKRRLRLRGRRGKQEDSK